MTIQSYLFFIATQPLLLRLTMVAVAVFVFGVLCAATKRLPVVVCRERSRHSNSVAPQETPRVIDTTYFG